MDRCDSQMDFEDFVRLAMSAISHETANTTLMLRNLFDTTLFQIQRRQAENNDRAFDSETIINKAIEKLKSQAAIKEIEDKYELSSIAIAAMAGTIS